MTQWLNVSNGSVFDISKEINIDMTTKDDHKEEEAKNVDTNENVSTEDGSIGESTEAEAKVEETPEVDLQTQFDELNRKYLLLYSDFDNYRKRSIKKKLKLLVLLVVL